MAIVKAVILFVGVSIADSMQLYDGMTSGEVNAEAALDLAKGRTIAAEGQLGDEEVEEANKDGWAEEIQKINDKWAVVKAKADNRTIAAEKQLGDEEGETKMKNDWKAVKSQFDGLRAALQAQVRKFTAKKEAIENDWKRLDAKYKKEEKPNEEYWAVVRAKYDGLRAELDKEAEELSALKKAIDWDWKAAKAKFDGLRAAFRALRGA